MEKDVAEMWQVLAKLGPELVRLQEQVMGMRTALIGVLGAIDAHPQLREPVLRSIALTLESGVAYSLGTQMSDESISEAEQWLLRMLSPGAQEFVQQHRSGA